MTQEDIDRVVDTYDKAELRITRRRRVAVVNRVHARDERALDGKRVGR